MRTLGAELRRLRLSMGLTQAQVAEALSIERAVLSSWERNKAVPDDEMMDKLCELYTVVREDMDKTTYVPTPESQRRFRDEEDVLDQYRALDWLYRSKAREYIENLLIIQHLEKRVKEEAKRGEDTSQIVCSFCGKKADEVERIIAGYGSFICNECVDLCGELLKDQDHGG